MEELVIEKVNKTVGSGENGTSAAQAQADLLKLLSQSRASGMAVPLVAGVGGVVGGMGGITAAQSRQNGSQLMRSYEALLQNSPSRRIAPPAAAIPGPTRRRKKKRRRQPDMPKKACTPFMHFCAYFKRKLMEEGKEFPQFADFGKRAGELWRNMGDEEKVRFNELSELDRKRYIKDMKEYEERKLAEKEREIVLAKQREEELQSMREKEMERMQQQQRDHMEHQQKHMEQQQKQGSNSNMMNMMNPLSPLSPIMLAALNQSLMQTVLTNPELLKTMYNEQIKNYYFEQMKSLYQVASNNMNGASAQIVPPASNMSALSGLEMNTPVSTSAMSSPLSNMGMNLNLLSLLRQSQLSSLTNSNRRSPSPKSSSPSRTQQTDSPITSPNNLMASALDLSASRLDTRGGSCSSDEDRSNRTNGHM